MKYIVDYESRLNSFSKSCAFQNYGRDYTHFEMLLIAAPQKIKEKLLLTPDLTVDIAKNIFKTIEVGSKWVSQASSIKLENKKDLKTNRKSILTWQNEISRKVRVLPRLVAVVNIMHAAVAVLLNTRIMIKLVPHWEINASNAR